MNKVDKKAPIKKAPIKKDKHVAVGKSDVDFDYKKLCVTLLDIINCNGKCDKKIGCSNCLFYKKKSTRAKKLSCLLQSTLASSLVEKEFYDKPEGRVSNAMILFKNNNDMLRNHIPKKYFGLAMEFLL